MTGVPTKEQEAIMEKRKELVLRLARAVADMDQVRQVYVITNFMGIESLESLTQSMERRHA